MKLKGLCEVCRERPATRRCEVCGRHVCDSDWRGSRCVLCELASCELCREALSVGYCAVCGRLVCEECSIEVGVARVCRECAAGAGRS
ncbi:MAG: hypothetical protein DRJ57_04690 [Thermoprotei archaeon]|nr:MAG: hypothetical protein DRJ67_00275 [Thermoprotei archaeon]RLE97237.1 MAG: hypothetical protein DRJ57_04690 [Thermoprotei archaeon]